MWAAMWMSVRSASGFAIVGSVMPALCWIIFQSHGGVSLSIGAEEGKGNDLVKNAFPTAQKERFEFYW
jgi:fatty acid/phospholipid biosynthesis enzyme